MDHAATIVALAYRFRLIIEGACEVVRAHCREDWVIGPRFGLINNGMMRRLRRFERLVELLLAGIADPVRAASRTPVDPSRPAAARKRCERWPGRRAWLLDKLGWRVALYGARMSIWLSDPEVQALLRSSRKMRRVLRPIWRALTSDTLPDCLREPARESACDEAAPDAVAAPVAMSRDTGRPPTSAPARVPSPEPVANPMAPRCDALPDLPIVVATARTARIAQSLDRPDHRLEAEFGSPPAPPGVPRDFPGS